MRVLRSMFTQASILDTKTKVKEMRTETGTKDTYQLHFLEKLFSSYSKKRGTASKQAALDLELAKLPSNTTSPVWRIKGMHLFTGEISSNLAHLGLDPHTDTPVEILHVILLGFVKYFWRDLVQVQLKSKTDKKELLATRLSSFDVSGLGISPLAGHTLVQYSGSLTGRDFRAIAQAAPFVIYDLVSKECFATWVALSKLIPLIWQPEISDIDAHAVCLAYFKPSLLLMQVSIHRNCWKTRSRTSSFVRHAGPAAGSINQSSIFCYISLITSDASARPYFSPLRPSSPSMLSFGQKVSIQIVSHHHAILPWHLLKAIVCATFSVADSSFPNHHTPTMT